MAYAMWGGGVGAVCVGYGEEPLAAISVDSCCSEPSDTACPPAQDGDTCCVDVFPPTMVEPVSLRRAISRDLDLTFVGQADMAVFARPPPDNGTTNPAPNAHCSGLGPPRSIDSIVRTIRLLL